MKYIDLLSEFVGRACSYLYLICVLVIAFEVVMRYFFNAPTEWVFEITLMLCATAWLLSGAYVERVNKHISVTSIYEIVPQRVRRILDYFNVAVSIIALSLLAYAAWEPALRSIYVVERTGTAFNAPMPALIKPLIVVGSVLYVLQLVARLLRAVRGEQTEETGHGH